MSDLIVRISGDSKKLSAEYKKVAKQTEDLENQIGAATKASAAAFVGFAGAIGLAASKAAELETIGVQFEVLTGSAEQAQKTVKELADFAASTPFQFPDIAQAGQQLLGFGFEADKISEKLQQIGDVSAAVGAPLNDLTLIVGQVASVGKLTGERLNQLQERAVPIGPALAKTMGVAETAIKDLVSRGQVDFATFEKAFASISQEGGLAFKGMEKRSQTLEGVISTLKDNFSALAGDIGKQFLPVLKAVASGMTSFIQFIRSNPVIASLSAKVLALGAGLSALVGVLGAGTLAFFKIRAAILAANVATKTLSIGVKGLVGATGIGLLLIVASEIYANWDRIWPAMSDTFESFGMTITKWINVLKSAFVAFGVFIGEFGSGIGSILKGAFTFDLDAIKEGLSKIKENMVNGVGEIKKEIQDAIDREDQAIALKVSTKKEQAEDTGDDSAQKTLDTEKKKTEAVDAETAKRIQALKDEQAILKATQEGQTKEQVEFLKRRQEIADEDREARMIINEEEKALALENVRIKNQALIEEEQAFTAQRRELEAEIREGDAELAAELDAMAKEARTAKQQEELESLRGSLLTQKEAEQQVNRERLQNRINLQNQFLKDQAKFGKEYATINKALNSEEVKGAEQAAGQLVALTNSKNNTLKSIGKAAALTQIGIDTAKGAMSAYASLSPIPFVGPALGAAAAAALIAYGVERTADVLSANTGGMVPKNMGVPGVDSVSALLTPGELVVPEQNFDEVVNAVANQRSGQAGGSESGGSSSSTSNVFNINGDLLADETFIDRLIDGINEAVEERNATLSASAIV